MATAFTRALARLHGNPDISVAALFRAAESADWIAIRVIRIEPDQQPGGRASGYTVQINGADLEVAPKRSDLVSIDDVVRKIEEAEHDELRLAWFCTLSPVAVATARRFTIGVSAIGGPDPIA